MQRAHRFALGALAACSIAVAALAAETQPQNAQNAGSAASSTAWSAPLQNKIAQCDGCHGIDGWRTAFPEVYHVPKLGGQKPEYIVAALKEYRSGERAFMTMRAIASQLSDADMEALAKHYGASATNTANEEKK